MTQQQNSITRFLLLLLIFLSILKLFIEKKIIVITALADFAILQSSLHFTIRLMDMGTSLETALRTVIPKFPE
jgi:hypothetical protein